MVFLENQTEKDRGTVICSSRKEIEKFFVFLWKPVMIGYKQITKKLVGIINHKKIRINKRNCLQATSTSDKYKKTFYNLYCNCFEFFSFH